MNTNHSTPQFTRRSALGLILAGITLPGAPALAANDLNLEELARTVAAANQAAAARFRRILGAAAQEEGLQLNLEQMVFASKYDYLFVGAPALGMERVDPIELRAGITQGMVYVEAAMARGLRGLYLVRAVAIQQVRPGDQPVRVQMLRGGVVMAEEIGVAQVWSLRVPSPRTGAQAELSVGFDLRGNGETVRTNCWTCPNGVTICVEKPICGVDGLLPGKC